MSNRSDSCEPGSCTCTARQSATTAARHRVVTSGAFTGAGFALCRGPLVEDYVLRAIIDDFLSHSRIAVDLNAKQVRFREALRRVAVKCNLPILASLNTKPTPYRTLLKALWDGCGLEKPKGKKLDLVAAQTEGAAEVRATIAAVAARYQTTPLAKRQRTAMLRAILADEKAAAHAALDDRGIVLLPGLVSTSLCEILLSTIATYAAAGGGQKLNETLGLGNGRAVYFAKKSFGGTGKDAPMVQIQQQIVAALDLDGGFGAGVLPPANTKGVLLCYAQGAENWAHQDANAPPNGFAYQALLMLSEPNVDFTGGELFTMRGGVADAWKPNAITFCGRGDVAVFKSSGPWFHGMHSVQRGSDDELCSRVAVGLFHHHKKK